MMTTIIIIIITPFLGLFILLFEAVVLPKPKTYVLGVQRLNLNQRKRKHCTWLIPGTEIGEYGMPHRLILNQALYSCLNSAIMY